MKNQFIRVGFAMSIGMLAILGTACGDNKDTPVGSGGAETTTTPVADIPDVTSTTEGQVVAQTVPAPTTTSRYVAPTTSAPPQTVAPAPSAFYENCDAAREAGAAPLHTGDPGYRSGLDRDRDGVACE